MILADYYSHRATYAIGKERLRHIMSVIPPAPAEVLDVGCGDGGLATVLQEKGYIVDGADISPQAIAHAQSFLRKGYLVDLSASVWDEGLMKQRYDVIVATEVLEHTFSPDEVLARLKELLNDDGAILITVPNFLFWKIRLRVLFGNFRYEQEGLLDYGHIRFFTYAYAKEIFSKTGLSVTKEHHLYPNLQHRKLCWLGNLFPGFFSYQFVFLLKKV